jgi:TRAP-type C4-dicarboxylate transport system permease small subunit
MKFLKLLDEHIEEWLLIFTYTAMLAIASAQVFFRYVINLSISWSQDLLTYMLIWSVFIGISLAVKKRKHIKVELAFVILPEKQQFYLKIFSNLVFMAFCGIFSYYSMIKVYKLIFVNPQISESTGLSMWMIQIAVPIGFILSIYRLVIDTRMLFKERADEIRIGG